MEPVEAAPDPSPPVVSVPPATHLGPAGASEQHGPDFLPTGAFAKGHRVNAGRTRKDRRKGPLTEEQREQSYVQYAYVRLGHRVRWATARAKRFASAQRLLRQVENMSDAEHLKNFRAIEAAGQLVEKVLEEIDLCIRPDAKRIKTPDPASAAPSAGPSALAPL